MFFILQVSTNERNGAVSNLMTKATNYMQHLIQNNTTLANHSGNVRKMKEQSKKSTNFGQFEWLIYDLPS